MPKLPGNILPKITVDTSGLEKLVAASMKLVESDIKDAVTEHAAKVEAAAKDFVPVRSGLLRESIHTQISKDGKIATVRTNAKTAPHGHLIHFGTVKMEGTPFLYMASEANPKEALAQLIQSKISG